METNGEVLEQIEDELLVRAFLYDHPGAYRDGVEAALEAIRSALEGRRLVA